MLNLALGVFDEAILFVSDKLMDLDAFTPSLFFLSLDKGVIKFFALLWVTTSYKSHAAEVRFFSSTGIIL